MIRFIEVSKKFGDLSVLEKINFEIEKGSFVLLMGPTGSGKTTIFRLIIRDLLPNEGQVVLGDWEVNRLPKHKISHLRRKVGVVFQDLKLLMDRTVLENVSLPLLFAGVKTREAFERAREVLNEIGLVGKEHMFPREISGGEKQRVAIARALVFEPEVILADEPTGNLDLATSFEILSLLEALNEKRGTTIFMATHNDKFAQKAKKRTIILDKGRIVKDTKT
jgi:cell division transport system ATP-binding protein